jgi:small subunit ribosomal protein S7
MSSKTISNKRLPTIDIKYKSYLVSLLIQRVLKSGKKTLAQNLIYRTFDIIIDKTNKNPLIVFEIAIKNARPLLEVKTKRIGGSTYRIPIEVNSFRSINLAIKWIINNAHKRVGRGMCIKLAREIIDTANNSSLTIKKKEETHKNAEANKAFSHFQ